MFSVHFVLHLFIIINIWLVGPNPNPVWLPTFFKVYCFCVQQKTSFYVGLEQPG